MTSKKSRSVPRGRDNRGYTLQTIIVMSILIAAAVGASVVLFRAVSTNTDVRSLTDLAGSNAPSRPHGFSVEKTVVSARSVPSATIRWSPPLYTGQTQLEGTPASVLYKVDYGCADPADSADINDLADITLENIPDLDSNNPTDIASTPNTDESKLDIDGPQTHYGNSTELPIPERIPEELFPSSDPPPTVYCILQAQAYTCSDAQTEDCANPGDNASRIDDNDPSNGREALTGREIYSLESEPIRFELSRAPTEPQNLMATVSEWTSTQNRVNLLWDASEYTGTGAAYLYEIKWQQREQDEDETDFDTATIPDSQTQCTVSNTHSIPLDLNADSDTDNELAVDFRITSYAVTTEVARNAVDEPPDSPMPPDTPWRSFICPDKNSVNQYVDSANPNYPVSDAGDLIGFPGGQTDLIGILLTTPLPTQPTLTFEAIPTDPAQKRELLSKPYTTVQAQWRVDAGEEDNIDSYELQWSRADGSGALGSLSIKKPFQYLPSPAPANTLEVRLDLEYSRAYNFSFAKKLSTGHAVTTSFCMVMSHPLRTPTPEIEVIPRASTELLVRIAPPGQERFCDHQMVDRVFTLSPRVTQHYKVRVYNPASSCSGDYPNEHCSDVSNQCQSVTTGQAAEEVTVTGLTASTTYEVEVIAGHSCGAPLTPPPLRTIAIDPPSPNPNRYGHSSPPVTKMATTPATGTSTPVAPANLTATFTADDPADPNDFDRWAVTWDLSSGAVSYLFTIDHQTTPATPAVRYAYTPSTTQTTFAARSPVSEFTCLSSATQVTCTIRDDDPGAGMTTGLSVNVQAVGTSSISTPSTQTSTES